jgi:hypothetical protein
MYERGPMRRRAEEALKRTQIDLGKSDAGVAAIKASDVMIAVEGNRKAFIEYAKKTWWLVFDLAHTRRVTLAGASSWDRFRLSTRHFGAHTSCHSLHPWRLAYRTGPILG